VIPALAALVAVAVLAAVLWTVEHRKAENALRGRMRRAVIVTLKTGESFSGVMFERDALVLVLRDAVDLQPNAPVPVDGELLVRWAEVAYVQLP
jgi:small nuclear ribonucleoprotein (snRNP)-like protein